MTPENLKKVLAEIREGQFAKEWIEDMNTGEKRLDAARVEAKGQQLEEVGKELRSLMQR